jgi:hypothetical protein
VWAWAGRPLRQRRALHGWLAVRMRRVSFDCTKVAREMSGWQAVLFCVGYASLLAVVIVGTLRLIHGRELWSLLRPPSVRVGKEQQ